MINLQDLIAQEYENECAYRIGYGIGTGLYIMGRAFRFWYYAIAAGIGYGTIALVYALIGKLLSGVLSAI